MPFDSATTELGGLADAARLRGITPVPMPDLHRHKSAQLLKHPGSWAYRHLRSIQRWLDRVALTSLIMIVLTPIGVLVNLWWGLALGGLGLVLFVGCFGLTLTSVKMPARWVERFKWDIRDEDIPPSIARIATALSDRVPGSGFCIGKLEQNSVILDPYLIITGRGQSLVLGIWDEDGIIQQATMAAD